MTTSGLVNCYRDGKTGLFRMRGFKMTFREIDKTNYWDCMALTVDDNQVLSLIHI